MFDINNAYNFLLHSVYSIHLKTDFRPHGWNIWPNFWTFLLLHSLLFVTCCLMKSSWELESLHSSVPFWDKIKVLLDSGIYFMDNMGMFAFYSFEVVGGSLYVVPLTYCNIVLIAYTWVSWLQNDLIGAQHTFSPSIVPIFIMNSFP